MIQDAVEILGFADRSRLGNEKQMEDTKMEMKSERHYSYDMLVRLAKTVETLANAGRPIDVIMSDLVQCHGLTRTDITMLMRIVGGE